MRTLFYAVVVLPVEMFVLLPIRKLFTSTNTFLNHLILSSEVQVLNKSNMLVGLNKSNMLLGLRLEHQDSVTYGWNCPEEHFAGFTWVKQQ